MVVKYMHHIHIKTFEKVHLKFCRAPNNVVYGELGRMPLGIKIKTRAVSSWSKLCTGKQSKLSVFIFLIVVCLHGQKLLIHVYANELPSCLFTGTCIMC